MNIPVYTIDEYTENDKQHFHALLPPPKELATELQYPVVLFKIGEHVITLDPRKLEQPDGANYFKDQQRRAFTAEAFNSLADFVGLLKNYNKNLDDSVAVVYSKKSAEGLRQECPVAWGVMAHQNRAILITHNQELAKKLKLEEDQYYVYYKPSFLTGHQDFYNRRTQINIDFLQATEGLCRDKFTPSKEFLDSKLFKKAMRKSQGLITTGLVRELADKDILFERTYDTEFLLDPEWNADKIKRISDKPIVLIYMPEVMSEVLVPKLKKVIPKFAGQFYFYFTQEEKKAAQVFPTDDLLGIPYIQIIDNTKKVLIKGNEHKILPKLQEACELLYDVQYHYKTGKPIKKKNPDSKEEENVKERPQPKALPKEVLQDPSLTNSVTYFEEMFKLEGIGDEVERFLKQYWGGELVHGFLSPSYKQTAEVKEVNTFKLNRQLENIVEYTNQFVIEAYAPHCGSCQYSGKILNAFSRKLKLHGMQSALPLFRMNSKNISPIFGRFPYTPMYFYVKLRKPQSHELKQTDEKYIIERVERIPPPLRFIDFKKALLEKAELPSDFKEKIHVHTQQQFQAYYFQKDLEENFFVDFDVEKAKEEEKKKNLEKVEAEEEKKKKAETAAQEQNSISEQKQPQEKQERVNVVQESSQTELRKAEVVVETNPRTAEEEGRESQKEKN